MLASILDIRYKLYVVEFYLLVQTTVVVYGTSSTTVV